MADDLKIRAGADTGDFETGMARIQKVAAKTEGSLENLAKEAKVAGNAITVIHLRMRHLLLLQRRLYRQTKWTAHLVKVLREVRRQRLR